MFRRIKAGDEKVFVLVHEYHDMSSSEADSVFYF